LGKLFTNLKSFLGASHHFSELKLYILALECQHWLLILLWTIKLKLNKWSPNAFGLKGSWPSSTTHLPINPCLSHGCYALPTETNFATRHAIRDSKSRDLMPTWCRHVAATCRQIACRHVAQKNDAYRAGDTKTQNRAILCVESPVARRCRQHAYRPSDSRHGVSPPCREMEMKISFIFATRPATRACGPIKLCQISSKVYTT